MRKPLVLITFCFLVILALLRADYDVGMRAYETKDYGAAFKEWRPLAEKGNMAAQNALGLLYQRGLGATKDVVAAAKWFHSAAEQGFGPSEYNLGLLYKNGEGVRQSDEEAISWLTRAANHGMALAELNLGNLYYKDGNGNLSQAGRWWRIAAEHGVAVAAYNFAFMNSKGQGVQRNNEESAKWYRLAADQGYGPAQYALALLYRSGTGVAADPVESRMWLEIAARSGVQEAVQDVKSAAHSITKEQIAKGHQMASDWKPKQQLAETAQKMSVKVPDTGPLQAPPFLARTDTLMRTIADPGAQAMSSGNAGTGFFVDAEGHVLTSSRAVAGCTDVSVKSGSGHIQTKVLTEDSHVGLAIVGPLSGNHPALAISSRTWISEQEKQVVVGYDLRESRATLQVAVPSKQPSGGGPILDESGSVVAVAPGGGASAAHIVKGAALTRFLDRNHISYNTGSATRAGDIGHVGRSARNSIVLIECNK